MDGSTPREDECTPRVSDCGGVEDGEEEWIRARDSGVLACESPRAQPGHDAVLRLQVLCPLCFSDTVVDPVLLHHPPPQDGAEDSGVCVACRECVRRWRALQPDAVSQPCCPLCGYAGAYEDTAVEAELGALPAAAKSTLALRNPGTAESDTCGGTHPTPLAAAAQRRDGAEVVCGACEEACAVQFCLHCDVALCAACVRATHERGLYRSTHTVVPLTEARPRRPRRCHRHPSQVMELYCTTCDVCACVTCCFAGPHTGHHITPLADVLASTKREMATLCGALDAQAATPTQQGQRLAGLVPDHAALVHGVESTVQKTFAALHDALRRREEQLLSDLQQGSARLQADVQAHARTTALLAGALREGCDKLGALVDRVDTVTLLRLKDTLTRHVQQQHDTASRQLQQVARIGDALRACVDDESLAQFTTSPCDGTDDLVSQLATLGTLRLTTSVVEAVRRHTVQSAYTTASTSRRASPEQDRAVRRTEAHSVRTQDAGAATRPWAVTSVLGAKRMYDGAPRVMGGGSGNAVLAASRHKRLRVDEEEWGAAPSAPTQPCAGDKAASQADAPVLRLQWQM